MSKRDFNPIIYNNYNIQIIYKKLNKPKIPKYKPIFSNQTLREAILNRNLEINNLLSNSVIENNNKKSRNKIILKNKSVEESNNNINKINRDTLFFFSKFKNQRNCSQSDNTNKLTNYYKNINNRFINKSQSNKLYHFKYRNLKKITQKFNLNYKIKKVKPILYPSINSQINLQNSKSFQKNDINFSFKYSFNKKNY